MFIVQQNGCACSFEIFVQKPGYSVLAIKKNCNFKLFLPFTVVWKGFVFFKPTVFFCFFFHLCHTWMIQIIKLILILHKDNPSKYKMQFWNNDLIYWGKKAVHVFHVLLNTILVIHQRKKKIIAKIWTIVNAVTLWCSDTVISFSHCWFHHKLFIWTVYVVVYGIIIILGHQNIGVDITFSVLSCLVEELYGTKYVVHNLVIAESKMVAMATTRFFCDGSISENV